MLAERVGRRDANLLYANPGPQYIGHKPAYFHPVKPPLLVLLVAVLTMPLVTSEAQDRPKTREEAQALIASLKFQQGEIVLKNGLATVKIPEDMRFLNGHDAGVVVVKLWGNPPRPDPLGLLLP